MTVKFLREILKHYEDHQYDDWEVELFDYNNQRVLHVSEGTYASSKDSRSITFPVDVEPVDGVTIDKRIRKLMEEIKAQSEAIGDGLKRVKDTLDKGAKELHKDSEEALKKINNIGKKDEGSD